ncbi:MAG: branched-chain amino acid transporter permease [Frankiales bacterium]|nr:branched-chain amino acid transporter permease [Frankiales bacterium]
MDAGLVLQVVLAGLSAGAVLGLVALGFTLIAGTVRVLHLAHGDVVVASVFAGVLGVLGRTPVASLLGPGRSVEFVLLVLAAGAVLAGLIAVVAVRPYLPDVRRGRPADALGWVAGGVAAGLLLRAVLGLLLPQEGYAVPDPLRLASWTSDGLVHLPGGSTLPVRTVGVLVLGVLVGVLVEEFLVRSRFGRSLRAVADDPDAAALCGVNAGRVVLVAFLAAGLLAGLAGLLDAPGRAVSVDDGVVLGLEGIAAALLGGPGSLRGALAGGLALGLLQAVAVYAGGASLQDVAPLSLLVVLLALRPQGLRR